AELSEESLDDRPAVQVGDPFLEKSLIEACLEAFKTGAVVAAQDMGAAGLTCSTAEMAASGGVGIDLDLDKIPEREPGMVPYEYLLSESQERMLFVAAKGREQELIDIFHRWGLQAVVAGKVIEEPIVRIWFEGKIAAEVPANALSDNTPLYKREVLAEPPAYAQEAWKWSADQLPGCDASGIDGKSWTDVLQTLLTTPSIASKNWVYRQYDHQVQNNTAVMPGGADAAVVRLRPQLGSSAEVGYGKAIAATVDCNSRYVYLDPFGGAKSVVAEAARNLSCVGAEPIAVTDNLNFGSPEKPIGYWQLAEACRGLSEGCRVFDTPVTGGNVSLYNETLDGNGTPTAIYPTPVVGMVGAVEDLSTVVGQGWQEPGDRIYLLGVPTSQIAATAEAVTLGASEYLAQIHDTIAGKPPQVDFDLEKAVQAVCRDGIRAGVIRSAHDSAEGGLAVALAECAIAANQGAAITLDAAEGSRLDAVLFAEGGARIIVTVAADKVADWEATLTEKLPNRWQLLGTVSEDADFTVAIAGETLIQTTVETMAEGWNGAIAQKVAGDVAL
ncbi:MAG: AIR synthase-related protein, partial [Cyanobacteria bacterium P01_F01_bin.153]